jgi:choice-of-anchor A domain-containing protein
VLFNFVEATSITAVHSSFPGTVLAPHAGVVLSQSSFDGGFYASTLFGTPEGRLRPLQDFDFCLDSPP